MKQLAAKYIFVKKDENGNIKKIKNVCSYNEKFLLILFLLNSYINLIITSLPKLNKKNVNVNVSRQKKMLICITFLCHDLI